MIFNCSLCEFLYFSIMFHCYSIYHSILYDVIDYSIFYIIFLFYIICYRLYIFYYIIFSILLHLRSDFLCLSSTKFKFCEHWDGPRMAQVWPSGRFAPRSFTLAPWQFQHVATLKEMGMGPRNLWKNGDFPWQNGDFMGIDGRLLWDFMGFTLW